jgi:hypothetical protein
MLKMGIRERKELVDLYTKAPKEKPLLICDGRLPRPNADNGQTC